MNKYKPTIGLEIHAELKTKSKMFCSCKNETFSIDDNRSNINLKPCTLNLTPNTNVCPVCLGMPGTLPILNKQAIDCTILTGFALSCKIGHPFLRKSASSLNESVFMTKWDRKNYFYPDLPKGYQISQYDLPICHEGYLEISNFPFGLAQGEQFPISNEIKNPKSKKIRITRIHLEEDTGTSKHPEGRLDVDYSLLDYNRAGVPLMELVTEPDIQSAEEAKEFCKEYQLILRNLGIADADMEKGQMRCEVNISLRRNPKSEILNSKQIQSSNDQNSKLGTKVEVKNLNSFKAVERSIKYEIERQTEVLERGEKVIQETRGWDDAKGVTYTMRVKETSADYRYFPEPDLPPVTLSKSHIEEIKKIMPESLKDKIAKYLDDYKLSLNNAKQISSSPEISKYFESTVGCTKYPNDLANLIVNEPEVIKLSSNDLAELTDMIGDKVITKSSAKEIIPEIINGKKISEIIKEKGLKQISNSSELEEIAKKVINANLDAVSKIKLGQKGVMGFLVGQIMRETKGQADPKIANEIINDLLK
jgi:aspartyl-tRNA(Asn)/glutamyl-tRNA(Gln) amidotransferase subunit B